MSAHEPKVGEHGILLPTSTRQEIVLDTLGTVGGLVPLLGGVLSNILLGVSGDRRFERVREVIVDLARRLDDLDDAMAENLGSEDFEDLLIEVLERVARERSGEKRAMYRQILEGAARRPVPYEDELKFTRTLEALQPVDIRVFAGFHATARERTWSSNLVGSPRSALRKAMPDINERQLDESLRTLEREGLISGVSGTAAIMSRPEQSLRGFLEDYGHRFHDFVMSGVT